MTERHERPAGKDFAAVWIAKCRHQLGLEENMPDLYRNDPARGRGKCTAWDGDANRLVCGDQRCATATVTMCGLSFGIDFDEDEIPREDRGGEDASR